MRGHSRLFHSTIKKIKKKAGSLQLLTPFVKKADSIEKTKQKPPKHLGIATIVPKDLTWKSDAPCIGGGRWEYGGRVSQCVSMEGLTPPHLSNDLEDKEEWVWCFYAFDAQLKARKYYEIEKILSLINVYYHFDNADSPHQAD